MTGCRHFEDKMHRQLLYECETGLIFCKTYSSPLWVCISTSPGQSSQDIHIVSDRSCTFCDFHTSSDLDSSERRRGRIEERRWGDDGGWRHRRGDDGDNELNDNSGGSKTYSSSRGSVIHSTISIPCALLWINLIMNPVFPPSHLLYGGGNQI